MEYIVQTKEGCNWSRGRNQARKYGENRYTFSIPLWFALRHQYFVEKRCHMSFKGTTDYAVF